MKILIVSFRYAPFNSIGANRLNAFVDYLKANNIEYLVLTAFAGEHSNKDFIHDENVIYYPYFNYSNLKRIHRNLYKDKNHYKTINNNKTIRNKIFRIFNGVVRKVIQFFLFPDPYKNWAKETIKSSYQVVDDFKPNVIFSSSYPYSSHFVARYYAIKLKLKWYAELRDPWVDNHVAKRNIIQKYLDKKISRKVFNDATGLITVSNTWKRDFEELYSINTTVIRNGYVKANKTVKPSGKVFENFQKSEKKKIVYTGSIFPENQDIYSFLKFFLNNKDILNNYDFLCVGSGSIIIQKLLSKFNSGVDNVFLIDKLPHNEALWVQNNADLLLLFNWNDGSAGIIPGKFYEYLGANRPILLWNNYISNELVVLSRSLNNELNGKILIIDDLKEAKKQILNFKYDNSILSIEKYSRVNQFDKLINLIS